MVRERELDSGIELVETMCLQHTGQVDRSETYR
jgi:hypothetical protein